MAEVIQIRPQGIYIDIRYSLEELAKLKEAYDHCQLNVNLQDPQEAEINRYFIEEHYPMIRKLLGDLKDGPGRNS